MSKNISTISDDELEDFLEEFGIAFKDQEDKKKERKESFNDLVDKASFSQVMVKETSVVKKRKNLPFFISFLLLQVIIFACLYYLYLRIEKLEAIKVPENFNPPYSENEIIIPLEPIDLYKKTSFPV